MEEYVHKTLKLLQQERQAEIDETKILIENTPVKELQRRGVCLLKLRISERKTGLYGRTVLVFAPYWEGKELPSHNFTPGDIAGIGLSQGQAHDTLCSGIVSRVGPSSVSVAIEDQDENLELDDNTYYKLVKLANDVTYTRLKKGLDNLNHYSSGPSSNLINVLFGVSELGPPISRARDGVEAPPIVFYNSGLDETQQEAVRFSLLQRELAIVHGPPGTGKTTTVVEIVRQAVKQNLKLLACAPSNIAVDNLVERLGDAGVKLVRLGHPARLLPKIQKYSLDAVLAHSEGKQLAKDVRSDMEKTLSKMKKCRNAGERSSLREEMKSLRKELRQREEAATREILKRSQVVLTTLTGISDRGPLKLLSEKHFDVVVIDECSQALEAACWLALLKAPRCVLAGDHNQLPPTIMSQQAAKGGLEVTLMERMLQVHGDSVMRMLTVQYRMHEAIMQWPSDKLYDGKLTAHQSVASHLLVDLQTVEETEDTLIPVLLIDTAGCCLPELNVPSQVSKANEGEADLVTHHIEKLVTSGLKPVDIAVIAPYNLQVELLRLRLIEKYPTLEIKSVDGFQGREKEAVVMCLVRSNAEGEVGFLAEERRINVAVTRARRHLAVVCDTETVGKNDFLQSLVDYMMEHGEVRSAQQYIDEGALTNEYKRPEYLDEKIKNVTSSPSKRQDENAKIIRNKKKGENQSKQSKGKDSIGQNKGGTDAKRHRFKPPKTEKEIEEEQEEERKLRKVIEEFLDDANKTKHDFPSSLDSRQRFLVHKIAEELGLKHGSHGEADDRHISITKSSEKSKPVATHYKESEVEQDEALDNKFLKENMLESLTLNETQRKDLKEPASTTDKNGILPVPSGASAAKVTSVMSKPKVPDCIEFFVCSKCGKEIPTSNMSLHELRCQTNVKSAGAIPKAVEQRPGTTKAKSKNKKKNKNQKKEVEEDFDSLIAEATKMNCVCNFHKCKQPTTVLGQNCEFCAKRFCLTHHIPEVHGCGSAAKTKARVVISKEGVLYRGSGVPDKKPDPHKKAYLQRKLDKKLNEMSDARKIKQKSNDKKGALTNEYKRPEYLDEKIKNVTSSPSKGQAENAKIIRNKKKGENQSKQSKGKDSTGQNKGGTDAKRHRFKPQKTEKEIEEEQEEESKLRKVIDEFVNDANKTKHDFPSSLDSRQRFLVHKIAEELGLKHESHGEADDRHISITKSSEKSKPVATHYKESEVEQDEALDNKFLKENMLESLTLNETQRKDLKVPASTTDKNGILPVPSDTSAAKVTSVMSKPKVPDCIEFSVCSKCGKEIPTSNMSLHELRCQTNVKSAGAIPKAVEQRPGTTKAKSKNKKKNKNQKKEVEEDFDSLIAEATKMNCVCNFHKCKQPTTVLGQNCEFCAKRFCLTHHIPEVHGCGSAAKTKARVVISKEGVLYRGSGVPDKKPDPHKKAYLQRKLDKKLNEMSDARKIKQKSNDKS